MARAHPPRVVGRFGELVRRLREVGGRAVANAGNVVRKTAEAVRWLGGGSGFGLVVLSAVADQFGGGFHAQRTHHVVLVGFYGAGGQVQSSGNLLERPPLSDEP